MKDAMSPIPDFTDAEHKLVSGLLFERYGKLVPMQLADSELQLGTSSEQLTRLPRSIGTNVAHTSSYAKSRQTAFVVSSSIPNPNNTAQATTNTPTSEPAY